MPRLITYSAPPRLEWCDRELTWKTLEEFTVKWMSVVSPVWVINMTVGVGASTDLASIPCFLRCWISKEGHHVQPAIAHDEGYRRNPARLSRAQLDLMFLDGMRSKGVRRTKRWAMYLAVRVLGWRSFRG